MADAIPSSPAPKKTPKAPAVEPTGNANVEFIGEGADKIKFNVDPKATRIRVYANGVVLTDYK